MNKHKSKYTSIYDRLISHPRLAWGLFIGFLIFTILVYAFKSYPFVSRIYEYIVYWSTALSAVFMLVIAYMAYISITENRRIREKEKDYEFKRRCLSDIQDWAEKGINVLTSWPVPVDRHEMKQIRPHLKPLSVLNKWVMDASRVFAGDDKKALLKKVDEAAENLKQYCEVLEGMRSSEGLDFKHDHGITLFTEVLGRIADVKVKLQL